MRMSARRPTGRSSTRSPSPLARCSPLLLVLSSAGDSGSSAIGQLEWALGAVGPGLLGSGTGDAGQVADSTGTALPRDMKWQSETAVYRAELLAGAESIEEFVGASLNSGAHEIRLYGFGENPPATFAARIAAAPAGTSVVWVPVPFTGPQLREAADLAIKVIPSANQSSIGDDFASVDIGVWPADAQRLAELQELATERLAPVPVHVEAKQPIDLFNGLSTTGNGPFG